MKTTFHSRRINKNWFLIIPEEARADTVIVGIDPGTTVGIAVVDLKGEPVLVESYRNKPVKDIIKLLSEHSPVLVASDVTPLPGTVNKVARAFNSSVYCPPEDLSVKEKTNLTRKHDLANDHQRDALAAALKAFHHYSSKIRKARGLAERKKEELERAALREVRLSDVLDELTSQKRKEDQEEIKKLRRELGKEKKRIKKLEEKNKQLTKKIVLGTDRGKTRKLEKNLAVLQNRLKKKQEEIKKLRSYLTELVEGKLDLESIREELGVPVEKEEKKTLSPAEVEDLFRKYREETD